MNEHMLAQPLLLVWKVLAALLAATLLPGCIEILLLTVAGVFAPRRLAYSCGDQPYRLAILIPAHNEELGIGRCLASIRQADASGVALRVIVVADNCSDATAALAQAAGAEVLIRDDQARRGKGYALNFAFTALAEAGIEGFAVVDADTEISPNFIRETANGLRAGSDATQCRYLTGNKAATLRLRLLGLASAAFNVIRPRGRVNLGFSAGLYGNGFALSAAALREIPYAAYSVVEDLEYHLMLVSARRRVVFLDQASVLADAPAAGAGADNQRARWEGGRLRMAYMQLPRLLRRVARLELRFVEPCLDLLLLPLAFHVFLLLLLLLSPTSAVRCFAGVGLALVLLHLAAAAFVAGHGLKDLAALVAAPFFICWKLLLIPKLHKSAKANAEWVRTERPGRILPCPQAGTKP